MAGEILVLPFHSLGHTFPAIELCRRLASHGHHVTIFLPPSSSTPTQLHPSVDVVEYNSPPPPPPSHPQHHANTSELESYLSNKKETSSPSLSSSPPVTFAVVDVMMSHLVETFGKHGIPVVSFFTSSASSAALEHGARKFSLRDDVDLDDAVVIPGLPTDLGLTVSHLLRADKPPATPPPFHRAAMRPMPMPVPGRDFHGPGGHPPPLGPPPPFDFHHGMGPHTIPGPPSHGGGGEPVPNPSPRQGHDRVDGKRPPRGIGETDNAAALIFNTCDDLEHPFLEYIAKETKKPAWGIGPLLPATLWERDGGSSVHDQAVRSKHESNVTEDEVLKWLESKTPGSVLYISFGTLECPPHAQLVELALALEESNTAFIWVLQTGPTPTATTDPFSSLNRARERGLMIRGWAPQLLILSHPSTGGFLSHCGWNSTLEAMACGVRMLTWPVKGDQFYNEKLVVNHLKVARSIRRATDPNKEVVREDVTMGMEEMMKDREMEARAAHVRSLFANGFPKSSSDSLRALADYFHTK